MQLVFAVQYAKLFDGFRRRQPTGIVLDTVMPVLFTYCGVDLRAKQKADFIRIWQLLILRPRRYRIQMPRWQEVAQAVLTQLN